jgi:hypothetical protein
MSEFTLHEALSTAIAIVAERCSETDTASPEGWRARGALETLEELLEQETARPAIVGNVLEYFNAKLGTPAIDNDLTEALESMPADSNCGDDCCKAIDNAKAFLGSVRKAYGDTQPGYIESVHDITAEVLGCFICG